MTFTLSRRVLTVLAFIAVGLVGFGIGALVFSGGDDSNSSEPVAAAEPEEDDGFGEVGQNEEEEEGGDEEEVEQESSELECEEKEINVPPHKEGSCQENGTSFVVVDKASTLKLPTLEATLVGIHKAKTVSGLGESVTANGTYVSFELEITNRSNSPLEFDPYQEQVALYLEPNFYTEDFEVQNGFIQDSFLWQGKEIQPEGSLVGTVTFDVPDKVLKKIDVEGNLNIVNFGESYEESKEVGTIRTYQ